MCLIESKIEEESQKNKYSPKKPEIGDKRYQMFNFKNEIDQLRMLCYDFFHKAPTINPVSLSVLLLIYTIDWLTKKYPL